MCEPQIALSSTTTHTQKSHPTIDDISEKVFCKISISFCIYVSHFALFTMSSEISYNLISSQFVLIEDHIPVNFSNSLV
jgi:hypothetical protein